MRVIEIGACPICRGGYRQLGYVATICLNAGDAPELRACQECGHWWHSPIPDQATLCELYSVASPYVVGIGAVSQDSALRSFDSFDEFALRVIRRREPARYLEIGAGRGQMMRAVRRMGIECHGVDPAQWAADPSIKRDISDLPPNLTFGIFVLKDVIEHVFDPISLLIQLRERAEANSIALASFPCCDSRPAVCHGTRWNMVRPYGHLHYFSKASALRLFEKSGWNVRSMRLSRALRLHQLLARFKLRALAYQFLKSGADQLHLYAST